MPKIGNKTQAVLLSLLLASLTLAVYWPVIQCQFVDYDDLEYVVQNSHVNHGLNWGDARWALTSFYASNWHPLTWISHMLDCTLYGLNPAGHHATNLVFHILNTVLIFLVLRRMTGASWRSAFVAALFALHPLHVESVAWVAERKDVLSTFFWALTIWAYARYAERRSKVDSRGSIPATPALDSRLSTLDYLLVLLFYALGLMSKPMLVSLPFLLLLLDYWPLGRFQSFRVSEFQSLEAQTSASDRQGSEPSTFNFQLSTLLRLILEKIPLLVMAVFNGVLTLWAQNPAMEKLARPFWFRLGNALLAYCQYIEKTVWPARLAVLYPFPEHLPIWRLAIALAALGCLSFLAVRHAGRHPYLFTGWFWFLGALLPTIGLVQVGLQSMADRYTYVPLMGLFIIVAWGGYELAGRRRLGLVVLSVLAVAGIAACVPVTRVQLRCWHDSVALFEHTLRFTPDNPTIKSNLAAARARVGKRALPAGPSSNP